MKGDRFALRAPNSIRWTALDLVILAEGLIVVPLYARQAPAQLVGMMKDAMPARICCFNAPTAAEIQKLWPNAPKILFLDDMFAAGTGASAPPHSHADTGPATIIYTSGTSGEPNDRLTRYPKTGILT